MRRRRDRFLRLFLRILGTSGLFALVAVVMPYSWMDAVHQWLGLGRLPAEPVVGYLARSTSAFYAIFGGLLWVCSFDLRRHRTVLLYVGATTVLFGVALLVVDLVEGLPLWWILAEGPGNVVLGLVILGLSYRVGAPHRQ